MHAVRLNDFPAYWGAGFAVVEGRPDRIYSEQWKWFTNLPVVAVACAPLALMSYETAWWVFWWGSLGCYALCFALLLAAVARFFPPLSVEGVAWVAVVFWLFAPVLRRCLMLGQTTPLMVLLFAIVYWLARSGRPRGAGLVLGGICVVKIPPMLLVPLLAGRRRLGIAVPAAAVFAVALLSSWAFFGADLMGQYADRVIWDNFGRSHAAFNNQSLDGAFMRTLTDRGLADWVPVPRPAAVSAAVALCATAVLVLLLARGRSLLWPTRPPRDDDTEAGSLEIEIALGVALMCLFFPIVWIHYYLFLVVPLAVLPFWWRQRGLPVRPWVVALLVAGAWLAGGREPHENAWYAAREGERLFRLAQNAQPLGALLLVAGLSAPLAEIARRQRGA